jgi:hypothetical protein
MLVGVPPAAGGGCSTWAQASRRRRRVSMLLFSSKAKVCIHTGLPDPATAAVV